MKLIASRIEILELFSAKQSEDDLKEIKSLLNTYLSGKVVREADKAADAKHYTQQTFEKWKMEHFRKSV